MFIIAEAGINHNGDLDLAKKLVDVAVESKVDAIKFQTFWNIGKLEKYEFSYLQWIELIDYCHHKHIMFLSTPHCYKAIEFLDKYIPIYKIASSYLLDPIFVKLISNKNKPTLISTGSLNHSNGMATHKEIHYCLKSYDYNLNSNIILMHCVSKYPCNNGRYKRIKELENKFNIPIGLSDHTKNIKLPKDLPVYEKHLMLDNIKCIDEDVSLNPKQFKEMVEWLKST